MILPFTFDGPFSAKDNAEYAFFRYSPAYTAYLKALALSEATESALGACVTYAAANRLRDELVVHRLALRDAEATLFDVLQAYHIERRADEPTEIYEADLEPVG